MAKRLGNIGFSLVFILVLCSLVLAQGNEQITITTYYPSPVGSYRELRADQMSVGPTYRAIPIQTAGGDRLIVDGNVGIGTSNPNQRLDVTGNANITGNTTTGTATVTGLATLSGGATISGGPVGNPNLAVTNYLAVQNPGARLTVGGEDVCLKDGTDCDDTPDFTNITTETINVTSNAVNAATVGGQNVCRQDGTGCQKLESMEADSCNYAKGKCCTSTCPAGYVVTGGSHRPDAWFVNLVDDVDFGDSTISKTTIDGAYSGGSYVSGNGFACCGFSSGSCNAICIRLK